MTKPVLWLSAFAFVVLVAVPLSLTLRMSSDAHAEQLADPEHQRALELEQREKAEAEQAEQIVDVLALQENARKGTVLERRRVFALLEEVSDAYGLNAVQVSGGLIEARTVLIRAGIDQPCIPIMEVLSRVRSEHAKGAEGLALMLSGYMALRKQGHDHASAAKKLGA